MIALLLPLALTGILGGIALSFIAPEELKSGWKYFQMAKFSLFVILIGVIGYSFWMAQNLIGGGIFVIFALILFILNLRFKYKWLEIVNYALFIIPYFFLSGPYQLLIASMLFLYGLPVGTLLWNLNNETKT